MALYAGLEPADALAKWYAVRQKPASQLTAEEKNDLTGGMTDLAAQNPAAWKLLKTGANYRVDPNNSGEHVRDTFNPSTGQWETKQTKGYWDHPESWMQLAFGAGMGGVGALAAAGAIGGGAGGAVAGGAGAFNAAGDWVPVALAGTQAAEASMPAAAGFAGAAGGGGGTLASLTSPDVIKAVIGTGGSLAGGVLANKAAANAADATAAATRYAAELQDAANKRAEQFLREQAENQYANTEAARRGNYGQWRARENRFSTLSSTLGAGARDIPDYVPGVDPRYTSSDTSSGVPDNSEGPGGFDGNAQDPNARRISINGPQVESGGAQTNSDPTMQALIDNYKALGRTPTGAGSGPTDIAYFAKRIAETGGLTDANKAYWFGPNGRIAKELAGSVPAEGSTSTALPSFTQSNAPAYQTLSRQPLTAPVDPTQRLVMPGSLAALAQQQGWFY